MIYEAATHQLWAVKGSYPACKSRQRVVNYEALAHKCMRSIVKLVVRVNIYEYKLMF